MKKLHLDCFYTIAKFRPHQQIKNDLLDLIATSECQSPIFPSAEVNISRCDWHMSTVFDRPWFKYIKAQLFDQMLGIYQQVGYDGFTLHEIWYQQYLQATQHGWHSHSCNFTSVYYLELPATAPRTQLINPFDQKTIIELEVSEGDIVVFPSFVIHRAPINTSTERKTIISYNTNVTYSDKIYATSLGN